MKIKTAVKEYILECEIKKFAKRTVRNYQNTLNRFMTYCEENDIKNMDDLTLTDIKMYTKKMIDNGAKGGYINSTLKILNTWLGYIWDEYEEGINVRVKKISYVKQQQPLVMAFKDRDVRILLDACNGNDFISIRDKTILMFLLDTGVRAGELCKITEEEIHHDYCIVHGKGSKDRVVPISPILKKQMMKYERAKESKFELGLKHTNYFVSKTGRVLDVSAIEYMMLKRGKNITSGARISPHTCRHYYAQKMSNKIDTYSLSRLLGHSKINTTTIYLRSLTNEDLIRNVRNNSALMDL